MTVPPNVFLTSLRSLRSLRTNASRRCGPIGTFSGVSGAGFRPAHATSPMPSSASLTVSSDVAGRSAADSAPRGEFERQLGEPAHAARGELQRARFGRRGPRLALVRGDLRDRRRVEEHGHQVDAGDAVDERVVGLRDQREAPALEALHEPRLPQRLGAIEPLRVDPRGQRAQLFLGARGRQRRVADVVLEVERAVVDPDRPARLKRRERQLVAVARHEVQPRPDVVQEVVVRRRRTFEDQHRPDVHVAVRPLLRQERGVNG